MKTKKHSKQSSTILPSVTVSCRNAGRKIDPRTVRRRAERILVALEHNTSELSIVLCDDAFIQQLNLQYRGKDSPTDVLSFSMQEGETMPSLVLGDVVISLQTAERQAQERQCKLIVEVTSLLVHGVLHLIGHTHDSQISAEKMFAESRRLERLFYSR